MPGEPILELRAVTKYMCRDARRAQHYGLADMVREFVPLARERTALRESEFASVDNVSFSVASGEALAIMGENGAGKTTLLRIIAGLIKPDRGELRVNCRVNSVIELGQGINPDLTGRENAELGLAWRGVRQRDTSTLMVAIAEFAELGDAWDSPVGTYSTGMRMRLAFAIAIHVPSDLLLLDEVLAVGDLVFQQKCFRAMQALLAQGCSIILVSHNVSQMQTICRRGLLIDQGRVLVDGPVAEAIDRLLELSAMPRAGEVGRTALASALSITSLRVESTDGSSYIRTGSDLFVRIEYVAEKEILGRFACIFRSQDLSVCISIVSEPEASPIMPGEGSRTCRIPSIPFSPGRYAVQGSISDPETLYAIATWGNMNRPTELHVVGEIAREDVLRRSLNELIQLPGSWTSSCDQNNLSQAWSVEPVMVDE